MTKRSLEIKVGLFVLLGIIILISSLYWLQSYRLDSNSQKINVLFEDVGMLKVGNIVTVSGVFKGKVNQMNLTEKGVQVEFILAGDVILKEDAQFIIRNYGLMGERFVAVYPGKSEKLLALNSVSVGSYDSGMPEVMGLMGEMVTELHELVVSFRQTVGSDSTLKRFNSTVDNLEQVSGRLNNYLANNETKMDKTVDNFLDASKKLNQLVANNTPVIDSSLRRFERISKRMDNFVIRLDSLSISAREFADKINNSDGSLQLFLEDRKLYDDLLKTADNVDDLIRDIKENPRKYINLKFELF
ncbi:MAG: MlaD family protein [candidate division Zixibacteria bacterium]|nr:MlaD family protein [candidate division Zixibacteria bacterium]